MISIGRIRKTMFWFGLTLPIFALLATIWAGHTANSQVNAAFNAMTRTYKVLNLLEEAQAHTADAETGQRGYLLTGRKDYFALYDMAIAAANSDVQQLKILVSGSLDQEKNLDRLQTLITTRLGAEPMTSEFKENPSAENAVALTDRGRETMGKIRRVLFKMRATETSVLAGREQEAESRFILDQTISMALMAVTALALIAVVAIVLRLEHLRQIVTICAWTGQVKYNNDWMPMEEYLKKRFGLAISHGLSQQAAVKMLQELSRPEDRPQ